MTAWSFSSLEMFEQCPLKYYHLKVAKDIKDIDTPERLEGNRIHKAFEERIGLGKMFRIEDIDYEPLAKKILKRATHFKVEQKIALTEHYQQTDWFAGNVWVRAIFDFINIGDNFVTILDWKTGKPHNKKDQLELFAAIVMALCNVNIVKTGFVWLKTKTITGETYFDNDFHEIWIKFRYRAAKIDDAIRNDSWPANPGPLCNWCPCTLKECKHARR